MLSASREDGNCEIGDARVTSLIELKRAVIEVTDARLVETLIPYDRVKVYSGSYRLNSSCIN